MCALVADEMAIACENGNLQALRELESKYVVSDGVYKQLLYRSIMNNHVHIVKHLLSMGADISACTDGLLTSVVYSRYTDMLNTLIAHGLPKEAVSLSVMLSACRPGMEDAFTKLYSIADLTDTHKYRLVVEAALYGNHGIIDFLINSGVCINSSYDAALAHGSAVLTHTCGVVVSASFLCRHPLVSASMGSGMGTILYLVSLGADLDKHKDECLAVAASVGKTDVVAYMIDHGADICYNNNIPMCGAAYNGHVDTVAYLLRCGATDANIDYNCLASIRKAKRVLVMLLSRMPVQRLQELLSLASESNGTPSSEALLSAISKLKRL